MLDDAKARKLLRSFAVSFGYDSFVLYTMNTIPKTKKLFACIYVDRWCLIFWSVSSEDGIFNTQIMGDSPEEVVKSIYQELKAGKTLCTNDGKHTLTQDNAKAMKFMMQYELEDI